LKVFLPEQFKSNLGIIDFNKSALGFVFSNLSDNTFNTYKKYINIKNFSDYYYFSGGSFTNSRDYDGDGINDITVTYSSPNITIAAASGKTIKMQNNVVTANISSVNLTNGAQSITLTNDYSNSLLKNLGFQTSSGKYGVISLRTSYSSYFNCFINATGENSFWGRTLTKGYDLYAKYDINPWNNYIYAEIRENNKTPEQLGWTKIGSYTSSDTININGNYNRILMVSRPGYYASGSMSINGYSNYFQIAGGYKANVSLFYDMFDSDYLINGNSWNYYGFWNDYEINGLYFYYYTPSITSVNITLQ